MAVKLVSTGVQFPDNTVQTTASSGGGSTVDLVAASGITAASPLNAAAVALTSDGKIEAVSESSSSASVTNVNYNQTNSYATIATAIVYMPTHDKCLTYTINYDHHIMHVITHSGSTASIGSTAATSLWHNSYDELQLVWESNRNAVLFIGPGTNAQAYRRSITVSGTTPTIQSSISNGSNLGYASAIAFSKKNNMYVALMAASNRKHQRIWIGSLPSNYSVTTDFSYAIFKREHTYALEQEQYDRFGMAYLDEPGVIVTCYNNSGDGYKMGCCVIDPISHFDLDAPGYGLRFDSGQGGRGSDMGITNTWPKNIQVAQVDGTHCFLFAYIGQGKLDLGIGSVNGLSSVVEQVHQLSSSAGGSRYKVAMAYDPDTRRVMVAYSKGTNGNLYYQWGDVDPIAKTITMDSSEHSILAEGHSNAFPSACYHPTAKHFVVNWALVNRGSGTLTRQMLSTINIGGGSNKGNFIGFVEDSVSQNATGEVKVGGIVELGGSANLAEGSVYYVQDDGSISTTLTPVRAGRAIKSDRLLLND